MLIIERPIGAGKTTEALRFLHSNGGGIYITADEKESLIYMLCKRHGFDNIKVLSVERNTPIVVDNEENLKLAVTKTTWKGETND